MTLQHPRQEFTNASSSSGFIASLLHLRRTSAATSRVDFTSDPVPGWTWSLIDTGEKECGWLSGGESALQVLHCADEARSTITIDGSMFHIVPGDNVYLGAGSKIELSGCMLALLIASAQGIAQPVHPPTHGTDVFDGFNRRTLCIAGPELALDRWKLTGPQQIEIEEGRPRVIVGLAGSVSLILDREIVSIAPGESAIVIVTAGSSDLIIVPDGLGYVAIAKPSELT